MKKLLVFILVITAAFAQAQSPGPYYRQFFFNPYPFNPAYAGINNQTELNLVYRKQWINFQDAPTSAGMSIQLPTSQRVAIGFNLLTDKQVLVKNSTFLASFVYVIPLSEKETIRFGMSGGAGMNKLDLTDDELNSNDPAISRAASNNFYADGNFGTVYTNGNLKLGFAMTKIFDTDPFTSETFNTFKFSNLKNRLYSASYRFHLNGPVNIAIEPTVLYRQSADGLQNYWEAATLAYFNQRLWTGASYNSNKGMGLFLGLNVNEKLSFSYSYELPSFQSSTVNASSHELQLKLRFGKKMPVLSKRTTPSAKRNTNTFTKFKQPNEIETDTDDPETTSEDTIPLKLELEPGSAEVTPAENTIQSEQVTQSPAKEQEVNPISNKKVEGPIFQEKEASALKSSGSLKPGRGHYVVAGVFQFMDHAVKLTKKLLDEGQYAGIFINPESNRYYVYIFSSDNIEEARKVRNQYRLKSFFKEAWIFSQE